MDEGSIPSDSTNEAQLKSWAFLFFHATCQRQTGEEKNNAEAEIFLNFDNQTFCEEPQVKNFNLLYEVKPNLISKDITEKGANRKEKAANLCARFGIKNGLDFHCNQNSNSSTTLSVYH